MLNKLAEILRKICRPAHCRKRGGGLCGLCREFTANFDEFEVEFQAKLYLKNVHNKLRSCRMNYLSSGLMNIRSMIRKY
jgi:hypothetical protein